MDLACGDGHEGRNRRRRHSSSREVIIEIFTSGSHHRYFPTLTGVRRGETLNEILLYWQHICTRYHFRPLAHWPAKCQSVDREA